MTAFTLGDAAAMALARVGSGRQVRPASAPRRTGASVRRNSLEAGTFEDRFFETPAKGEPDRMLRAARAALDAGRRLKRAARAEGRILGGREDALAALTDGAVRVFEEICTLARLNAGRVFPSYDRLAKATALGRATVARALRLLEAAGFLIRQRRFKRMEGEGPRYAQTSNVYRPAMPQGLVDLLPRWLRPAPLPADALQHAADRADEIAAMEAQLPARERVKDVADNALGQVLARLAAAIDRAECESHREPEPLPHLVMNQGRASESSQKVRAQGSTRTMQAACWP
jgi:hypothetical protein